MKSFDKAAAMQGAVADDPRSIRCDQQNDPVVDELLYAGLSRRERFAGMAMQGIISNTEFARMAIEIIARDAVTLADALIIELDKRK